MKFGSHLYGTATPESDQDYKGVFMPEPRDVLLGRIPRSVTERTNPDRNRKNAPADVDSESFSLHHFVGLAVKGETVALDMLHAPRSAVLRSSLTWRSLVSNRKRFYTRNLRSLVSYARRQAAKYGVKGSRLADARLVLNILEAAGAGTRVGELELPTLEHARWVAPPDEGGGVRCYQVCGKLLQETARAEHYAPTMRQFVDEYGHRARQAERNEGVDWKALSHALRAGFQTYHILTARGFEYPLPETDLLLRVKRGELPFREVAECLEALIERVERLSESSPLPERADRAFWDDWLEGAVASELGREILGRTEPGWGAAR